MIATRKKAEIDLTEAVGKVQGRVKLWRTAAAVGGVVVILETIYIVLTTSR